MVVALTLTGVVTVGSGGQAAAVPEPDPVGVWPLSPAAPPPEVVHGFAPPSVTWGAGHRGVDLRGAAGGPVATALAGTVTFAGPLAGRGVVVVSHGATRTTYEPILAGVPVGAQMAAGDQIGVLSGAGSHCAPQVCLHWGWLRGQEYLDPLRLVGSGPVRLLPLSAVPPATHTRVNDPLSGWWRSGAGMGLRVGAS